MRQWHPSMFGLQVVFVPIGFASFYANPKYFNGTSDIFDKIWGPRQARI